MTRAVSGCSLEASQRASSRRPLCFAGSTGFVKEVRSRGPACNSDHCPFVQKGVPAIFIYTMGGVSYYHDVMDRPETLPLTKFDGLYRTLATLLSTLK